MFSYYTKNGASICLYDNGTHGSLGVATRNVRADISFPLYVIDEMISWLNSLNESEITHQTRRDFGNPISDTQTQWGIAFYGIKRGPLHHKTMIAVRAYGDNCATLHVSMGDIKQIIEWHYSKKNKEVA